MKIISSVFENNGNIPQKYTCEGENTNPPLSFHDVPKEAKSLVILMEDPDVPRNLKQDGMFDHWVVFNIPPDTKEINEGEMPEGIIGKNSVGKNTYIGPCPPDREHRYFFKLYALDTMLHLGENATKTEVGKAVEGHVLSQAELVGRYDKKNK